MKSLGEYLQTERQARGVSLEQISADTRISMSMLKAIEDGNTEKLPAPVLVKGFIRAYAGNIGLDPEAVILRYQDLVEEGDYRQEALEKFHRRLRPRSSRNRGLVILLVLVVLTALALAAWHFYDVLGQPSLPALFKSSPGVETHQQASQGTPASAARQQEQPAPKAPVTGMAEIQMESVTKAEPESAPVDTDIASADTDIAPEEPQSAAPSTLGGETEPSVSQQAGEAITSESEQPASTPPPEAPVYVLRARAVERTWLSITIDKTRVREYMLRPGQELEWQARSSLNLIIGNAGGVQLYLNDRPLKPLGERGKVVNLTLPDPSLFSAAESG